MLVRSNQILRPIVKPPSRDFDSFKTPTQLAKEQEINKGDTTTRKVVSQSIDAVYKSFQKLVENTDYSVGYNLNDTTGIAQISIRMQNSGNEVISFPTNVAQDIASRAKFSIRGLIANQYA